MKRAAKRARRHVARKLGIKYDRSMEGAADVDWKRIAYARQSTQSRRKNPTKAQKREKARKAGVQRRVAAALAKYLKQVNPAVKLAGAKVQKLKGGVLKITPIKANAAKPFVWQEYSTKTEAVGAATAYRARGVKVKIAKSKYGYSVKSVK